MELHIVGTNAITYPVMHVWDWRIASYLFLGGLAGGLMTMSAINYIRPGNKQSADAVNAWKIPVLIPILLTIGLIFINLRDHAGIIQVVIEPDSPAFVDAERLRNE